MTPTVAPTREDAVARAASEVAGGPAGRHAGTGRHGWWTASRALALLAVPTVVMALLARQHCRVTLWAAPDEFVHACYSDLPALYAVAGLDRGLVPYLEAVDGAHLTQPVGTGGLLALLAWLAPGGPFGGRWVFDLGALVVAVALVATVLAVAALAGRRPWDAALVALSPVVVVTALISLDLVAVALASAAMLALARRRPGAAGVLVGLAVAVRPMALVVLIGVVLLGVRAGRTRTALRACAGAALGWGLLNVPVAVLAPDGWAAYWRSLLSAPVDFGSIWLLPGLAGHPVDPGLARWLSFTGTAVVLTAAVLVALGARRRPRLPALALLLVVGLLLTALSVPVQASLWLLPFAALAVPRWRDHLLWGGVEVAYATGTWLYLYGLSVPARGLPAWAYALLIVLRLAAMCWLARQALLAVRDPALDPVRSPRDAPGLARDDPTAGDIEGAPDALVVRAT